MMTNESPTAGERLEPNLFQLRGTGAQVSFQSSSFAGQPQLSYTDAQGSRTFSGEEVRSEDSEIGKIVSVTLQLNPDSQIVTLSLLVPSDQARRPIY